MRPTTTGRMTTDRLFMPVFSVLTGALLGGASWVGGQPGLGLVMFAIMAGYATVLFLFGGRSETVATLGGRPTDERFASFNLRATAVAGTVAMLAALAGFLWEIAHGRDGLAYALVDAAAGLAYLVALAWLRWRD